MQPARIEIGTVLPGYGSVDEADLLKDCRITKGGEHASVRARNEGRQVSRALHAVIKRQRQTIVWQRRDSGDTPGCRRCYRGRYSSGMIFLGICLA